MNLRNEPDSLAQRLRAAKNARARYHLNSGAAPSAEIVRPVTNDFTQPGRTSSAAEFTGDGASRGSRVLPRQPQNALARRLNASIDNEFRRGLRVMLAVIGIGGACSGFIPFSGAIIAPGVVVTVSGPKKIQHPTGGIIEDVLVHDGSRVEEGQVLARLDATTADTNLKVVVQQLDEARLRASRLTAERDGLADFKLPPPLLDRRDEASILKLAASEVSVFVSRDRAQWAQTDIMQSRHAQLEREAQSTAIQIRSNQTQLAQATAELGGVQSLYRQNLVALPRLSALQREVSRLESERTQLLTALEDRRARITETDLEAARSLEAFRIDAARELRETEGREAELAQRHRAGLDQLNRTVLRAPQSGIVHQLAVRTRGGVVGAGEILMLIVPDTDALQVETHVQSKDIDQVEMGQHVDIRFSGFDRSETPTLEGAITHIAADAMRDTPNGPSNYLVLATIPAHEQEQMTRAHLQSGMPAEVFIRTKSRTLLSYLLKPLADQWRHALRER